MKCVKVDLPTTISELKIEIFADCHLGSKVCDYSLIQERIKRVQKEENTYALILGDLINNSTKTSVGDCYEDPLSPMDQMKLVITTFEPIKDKIIGIVSGNHERRTYKTDGIDLMWLFAKELNLIDKYDYVACLLFIRFGKMNSHYSNKKYCTSLYMSHGDGQGGRTIGGKANGLQRRGQIVNASIIVTGHTHAPLTFRDAYYEINYGTSSVKLKDQLFINASACLGYENYAEQVGLRPSPTKSPTIIIRGGKDDVLTDVVL